MDESKQWYLMKHDDGTVFGPVRFSQLKEWAMSAQISPLDKVSDDQLSWAKAPTLAELKMDWLLEVGPEQYYGPTTIGAVREFIRAGEVNADTMVIDCCSGAQSLLRHIAELQGDFEVDMPARTGIRQNLQQRIRELELALMEERRARTLVEEKYARLEAQHAELARKSG